IHCRWNSLGTDRTRSSAPSRSQPMRLSHVCQALCGTEPRRKSTNAPHRSWGCRTWTKKPPSGSVGRAANGLSTAVSTAVGNPFEPGLFACRRAQPSRRLGAVSVVLLSVAGEYARGVRQASRARKSDLVRTRGILRCRRIPGQSELCQGFPQPVEAELGRRPTYLVFARFRFSSRPPGSQLVTRPKRVRCAFDMA